MTLDLILTNMGQFYSLPDTNSPFGLTILVVPESCNQGISTRKHIIMVRDMRIHLGVT